MRRLYELHPPAEDNNHPFPEVYTDNKHKYNNKED